MNYIAHMLHGAGIFTNICPKNHPNVVKYTIHGAYGLIIFQYQTRSGFIPQNVYAALHDISRKLEQNVSEPRAPCRASTS